MAKQLKTTLAFHGDEAIKAKYVERVKAHAAADEIVQGKYWQDGKGCAVGCTVEQSDSPHEAMEAELGIPRELAYLEDTIFEGLTNSEAKAFPLRFLQAIKPGADLSTITAKFMIWQFEDAKYGLKNIDEVKNDAEVYGFCEEVVALYRRVDAGDSPTEAEFYELYERIDRAPARARAWAPARAWAWAWAEDPYWTAMADKLVELLEEAE